MLSGAVGCCVDTHVGIQASAGAGGAATAAPEEPVPGGDDGRVAHARAPAQHARAATRQRHVRVRLDRLEAAAVPSAAPPANALRQTRTTRTTQGILEAARDMPPLISRKRFPHTKLRIYGKQRHAEQQTPLVARSSGGIWAASDVSLSSSIVTNASAIFSGVMSGVIVERHARERCDECFTSDAGSRQATASGSVEQLEPLAFVTVSWNRFPAGLLDLRCCRRCAAPGVRKSFPVSSLGGRACGKPVEAASRYRQRRVEAALTLEREDANR